MSLSSSLLGGVGHAPLFTVSQWAEMEHQAMVFKFLVAGLPVPPDLLAPLRFSHSSLTYASLCRGKKIDTEPGRCRRTDGKKWRCSKDAYPDSKYCEHHMNRGRYRSRKLVESQQTAKNLSTNVALGSRGRNVGFQNTSLDLVGNCGSLCFGSRDPDGSEGHNFMLGASGSAKSVGLESTINNPWSFRTSEVSSNSSSAPRNGCFLLNNNSQQQTLQDSEVLTKQQERQYVGGEFGTLRSVKKELNSLRPFFDEGPESRDLGSPHNDSRSTNNLSDTTQLSMSNLMAASDFFKDR